VAHVADRLVHGRQRHGDPGLAEQPGQFPQVLLVRAVGAVLVLDLHQDDRPAPVGLAGDDDRREPPQVPAHRRHERRVAAADGVNAGLTEPAGQAPVGQLGADVRPGADDREHPLGRHQVEEAPEVEPAVEPELIRPWRVRVPGDVGLNRVQAHLPCFPDPVSPVAGMDTEVVQRAGEDAERLAVEQEVALADGELAGLASH
jgi:hypothetical protein